LWKDRPVPASVPPALLTIGHSNHPIERFLELLTRHGVTALGDVRSFPRSRFNPQYNRDRLEASLKTQAIGYVHLGEALGGMRGDFGAIAALPAFAAGLDRVREGATRHRIALMCAEKDPLDCHRFVLICRHLRQDLRITHILGDGSVIAQDALEDRLIEASKLGGAQGGLLAEDRETTVQRAYDARGAAMTRGAKARRSV
jgi:uncharacterized protein (DUF488 family)